MPFDVPQEIVEIVVSYASYHDDETCRNMLTVSRRFQVAVERLFFWTDLNLRSDDMELFLAYCHGPRMSWLRDIRLTITFPKLHHTEEEPLKCRETPEDLQAMDELFTLQISELFVALNTIQDRATQSRHEFKGINLTIATTPQEDDGELPCYHRQVHHWRLRLLKPEMLPELPSIGFFAFKTNPPDSTDLRRNGVRPVDLRAILDLISRLPNLEELYCSYLFERFTTAYGDEVIQQYARIWEGPWRDTRHDFAKAVEDFQLAVNQKHLPWATLKKVDLCFWGSEKQFGDTDQELPLPNLAHPRTHDPLSSALRVISQNLTELDLQVIADSTLFWPLPSTAETDSTPPSWPNLKRLAVEFHPSTPSGTWYFDGPRDAKTDAVGYAVTDDHYPPVTESEEDNDLDSLCEDCCGGIMDTICSDCFRTQPVEQTIEPFLEAFARALRNMPVLEEAVLYSLTPWEPTEEDEDYYHENGLINPGQSYYRWSVRYVVSGGKDRLEWRVGEWRPSEALLRLFQDMGAEKELEVEWMDVEWSQSRYHSDKMPPTKSYLVLNPKLGRKDSNWP